MIKAKLSEQSTEWVNRWQGDLFSNSENSWWAMTMFNVWCDVPDCMGIAESYLGEC